MLFVAHTPQRNCGELSDSGRAAEICASVVSDRDRDSKRERKKRAFIRTPESPAATASSSRVNLGVFCGQRAMSWLLAPTMPRTLGFVDPPAAGSLFGCQGAPFVRLHLADLWPEAARGVSWVVLLLWVVSTRLAPLAAQRFLSLCGPIRGPGVPPLPEAASIGTICV